MRLPLHELCRLVEFIDHLDENEFTDDEDEGMFSKAERRTNQEIYQLARLMILQSQTIDTAVFHPNLNGGEGDDGFLNIERHRSILSLRDLNGNTALHVLCSQCADPTMMRIMLECCPTEFVPGEFSATAVDLVAMRNAHGCTPLHYISGGACPFSAFKLLVQYSRSLPNGDEHGRDVRLLADVDGDIPLHWAFAIGASPRRLRALLNGCHESLFCKNGEGKLPMQEFVEHHCDNWDFLDDDEKRSLWREMQDILKVVTDSQDDDTWSPLHAIASGVDFIPKEFWLIGTEFCATDTYNSDGLLPLHVAVSSPPRECRGDALAETDTARSLLHEILFCNIELARRPTSQGRLPLHLAAESKQPEWIVGALRNASPDALLTFDPVTGLPPAMLAAVNENNSLDMVYYLLRSEPSILQTR